MKNKNKNFGESINVRVHKLVTVVLSYSKHLEALSNHICADYYVYPNSHLIKEHCFQEFEDVITEICITIKNIPQQDLPRMTIYKVYFN